MNLANPIPRSVLTGIALLMSAQAASAQSVCTMRDETVVLLERRFDEQVAGRGLAANGERMLELFVSETGSWTVLVSDAQGRSCVVASGENWQAKALVLGDPA